MSKKCQEKYAKREDNIKPKHTADQKMFISGF